MYQDLQNIDPFQATFLPWVYQYIQSKSENQDAVVLKTFEQHWDSATPLPIKPKAPEAAQHREKDQENPESDFWVQ